MQVFRRNCRAKKLNPQAAIDEYRRSGGQLTDPSCADPIDPIVDDSKRDTSFNSRFYGVLSVSKWLWQCTHACIWMHITNMRVTICMSTCICTLQYACQNAYAPYNMHACNMHMHLTICMHACQHACQHNIYTSQHAYTLTQLSSQHSTLYITQYALITL